MLLCYGIVVLLKLQKNILIYKNIVLYFPYYSPNYNLFTRNYFLLNLSIPVMINIIKILISLLTFLVGCLKKMLNFMEDLRHMYI